MPGRTRYSFRCGNLAEDFGLLLLKGIAAVAEVSRPEDVGLDAIATLLRPDPDGNLYAEDTFLVQLKSDSVTSLHYQDHELRWLIGHTQPVFIGLVSLRQARISLYPTVFVNQAVAATECTDVTIRFGFREDQSPDDNHGLPPWSGRGESEATVWLGPPLLEWTLQDLNSRDWTSQTYDTLKRFLSLARLVLEVLPLGQFHRLRWLTNDLSSVTSKPGMMKGHQSELAALVTRCEPVLEAIMFRAACLPKGPGTELVSTLLALSAAFRECGVDFDSRNSFKMLAMTHHYLPGPATPRE